MAQQDVTKQQPIGYWLKRADAVITEHVDRVLSDNGFTRFRWQVLNIVYQAGTITRGGVFDTMQTFIDARQLDETIDGFIKEGWLVKRGEGDAAQLMLTDVGKAQRETAFKLQSEVRRRAMQGISEQEYATVVDVLERMVKNLE
ncbi:MAG TPA: MarR family winged helix-turn-helix transcriptional regulator [Rubrobacter sp.]|jgi:DNA-binding MarR family transcriptional regulator|nr:MarR family winged helix-turn-helix transcriptional regulator [Rubrobacter sp.]